MVSHSRCGKIRKCNSCQRNFPSSYLHPFSSTSSSLNEVYCKNCFTTQKRERLHEIIALGEPIGHMNEINELKARLSVFDEFSYFLGDMNLHHNAVTSETKSKERQIDQNEQINATTRVQESSFARSRTSRGEEAARLDAQGVQNIFQASARCPDRNTLAHHCRTLVYPRTRMHAHTCTHTHTHLFARIYTSMQSYTTMYSETVAGTIGMHSRHTSTHVTCRCTCTRVLARAQGCLPVEASTCL